jgi:outer membrane usher protein
VIRAAPLGALLLLPLLATGQPAPDEPPGAPPPQAIAALTPAWFDLEVNDVPKGSALVRLGAGDVWIAAEDLERAGLDVRGGDRIVVGDRSQISLRSLAPGITFVMDEAEMRVRITAGHTVLGRAELDLNPYPRPDKLYRSSVPSAFLNVGGSVEDWSGWSGSAELGLAMGPALLLSSMSVDSRNGPLRGLTTAQWDDVGRLLRARAGEFFVPSRDPLGGSAMLLGLSIGREFSLDPYLLHDPYPRTSLFVPTPSTLEVWVGDTLVRRTPVLPGTLELENLPLSSGANEVRTVLRDAFGREQSASSFFLMGTNLLSAGLVDWGVSAGWQRTLDPDLEVRYSAPTALGHYRAGLNRLLTLGARAEAGEGGVNVGGSIGAATGYGDVEAGAAASRSGDAGVAGYVAWRKRLTRRVSLAAEARALSDRYSSISLQTEADRAAAALHVGGVYSPHARVSITGDLSAYRQRDGREGGSATVRGGWAIGLGKSLALTGTLASVSGEPSRWEVYATYSMQLPSGNALSAGARHGSRGESAWVSAMRGLGYGPGVGYRVEARGGDAANAALDLRGQTDFGRAAFMGTWGEPWTGAEAHHETVEASAGLLLMDGELRVTRPIDGSYAVVVLEGSPNVRVTRDGQTVGRTDASGKAFVPDLIPYFGNRIGIREADLPLDYKVNELERYVAPRYRGGTVERFDVGPTRVVVGKVVLAIDEKGGARDVAPEWGEIAVELPTGRVVSPIGAGGEFWLEGLAPGRQEALVRWEGRLCRFTLEVGTKPGIVDVGLQRCVQMLAIGGPAGAAPN